MTEETIPKDQNTPPEQTKEETPQAPQDDLQQQLDEARKAAEGFKDQLLRKAAEFENYKRRAEIDYLNTVKNANEGLILSLLPILDDLLRSLKVGKDLKDYDSFYKGVELVYAKFSKTLEGQGVTPFESTGKPFDVEYHDALLQVPREDVPPHTVIEEVQRGYKLYDKILRHAKVIVSAEATTPVDTGTMPDNGEKKEPEDA